MPAELKWPVPALGAYEAWRNRFTPPWLGDAGAIWNRSLGALQDEQVLRAKLAVKARFPSLAPPDALPLIAQDRLIERGPVETDPQFAARLKNAFGAWRYAGTRKGLTDYVLAPAGFTNVRLITNREWAATFGGVPPDGDTSKWARFWVVVGQPPTYTARTWGSFDFGTDVLLGSDASADDVTRLRRLLLLWKSARDLAMGAFIVSGTSTTPDSVPSSAWVEDSITFDGAACNFWRFS